MKSFSEGSRFIILAILVSLASMSINGCDGLVPDIQNNSLIEPDHEYELDTWLENSEVYEFTPRSNKNYTRVFVMLDSESGMGLQCFPKPIAK